VDELTPSNDTQRGLKARASQLVDQVSAARWLALLQANAHSRHRCWSVLVAWLSILFRTFGLFTQRNRDGSWRLWSWCALSTSGAIS